MSVDSVIDSGDPPFHRVALCIEYNGSAYSGWQIQAEPVVATIQASLEQALSTVANEPIRVICAGRTDARVHATNQVIHFDTQAVRDSRAWVLGGNANLPNDIAIRWAVDVPNDFHARFSAHSRIYRYVIYNGSTRPALSSTEMTWDHRVLDVSRMERAAQHLVGEHDFSSFRAVACQAKSPTRKVEYIKFFRYGDLIYFEVKANAFLQHMVRNFAGALISVGAGDREIDWVADVLKERDRRVAGVTAKPNGLYLVSVRYDQKYQLPVTPLGPHFLSMVAGG